MTHEQYIANVRAAMLRHAEIPAEVRERIENTKAVYGSGMFLPLRGVTFFGQWQGKACSSHGSDCGDGFPKMNGSDCGCRSQSLVEICASGEESWIQLAGTTVHEYAHVAAGPGAGHGKEWQAMCKALGLRRAHAAGTVYQLASFKPALRHELVTMPHPADGAPAHLGNGLPSNKMRPCGAGVGTRGGKSRGKGSGSRLRKFTCDCGVIVRAARDELHAHCDDCGSAFTRA